MLPLRPFTVKQPCSMLELKALLKSADSGTKILAGGTDLIPNLKHGLYDIKHLISLRKIDSLYDMSIDKDRLQMGALIPLTQLDRDLRLRAVIPALSKAASQIASPQIRNMGTIGGNICLDTRCLYFNQSQFWRKALGYCLKKDGSVCHVVKNGKRCVAAASNDLATVLLTHDAHITIVSPDGQFSIKLNDFYLANGEKNHPLADDQVVTAISMDLSPARLSGFFKLRHRAAIDFSLLSTAVSFRLDSSNRLIDGLVAINALVAKPKVIDLEVFHGALYREDLIGEVGIFAAKKCHPQTNICDDTGWRKEMIVHCIKQAFLDARRC